MMRNNGSTLLLMENNSESHHQLIKNGEVHRNKKGKGGTRPLMKNTVKSSNGKEC